MASNHAQIYLSPHKCLCYAAALILAGTTASVTDRHTVASNEWRGASASRDMKRMRKRNLKEISWDYHTGCNSHNSSANGYLGDGYDYIKPYPLFLFLPQLLDRSNGETETSVGGDAEAARLQELFDDSLAHFYYGLYVAALMAVDDVNHDIEDSPTNGCSVRVPKIYTLNSTEDDLFDILLRMFLPNRCSSETHGGEEEPGSGYIVRYMPDFQANMTLYEDLSADAVLGPARYKHLKTVSDVLNIFGNKQTFPTQLYMSNDDVDNFKNQFTTSMLVRNFDTTKAVEHLLKYLVEVLDRDYVGVLYEAKVDGGEKFWDSLKDKNGEIDENGDVPYNITIEEFRYVHNSGKRLTSNEHSLFEAMTNLKETRFTTIVVFISADTDLHQLMEYANELGIVGDDFFWLILGQELDAFLSTIDELSMEKGSVPEVFLSGSAIYHSHTRKTNKRFQSRFESEVTSMHSRVLEHIPDISFARLITEPPIDTSLFKYFLYDAALVYDSVLSLVLWKCEKDIGEQIEVNDIFATDAISFFGATGNVYIDKDSRVNTEDVDVYSIFNVRTRTIDESASEVKVVEAMQAVDEEWFKILSFQYADGSFEPPHRLRLVEVDLTLPPLSLRLMYVTAIICGLLLNVFTIINVRNKRHHDFVKETDPLGFYLLSLFSILTVCCQYEYSLNDQSGLSNKALSALCNSFCLVRAFSGIMICHIYVVKLIVINRVVGGKQINFREIFFRPRVLMIVLLYFLILLVVKFLFPIHYFRHPIDTDQYGWTISSFGSCGLDDKEYNKDPSPFQEVSLVFAGTVVAGSAGIVTYMSYLTNRSIRSMTRILSPLQKNFHFEAQLIFKSVRAQCIVVFGGSAIRVLSSDFFEYYNSIPTHCLRFFIIYTAGLLPIFMICLPILYSTNDTSQTQLEIAPEESTKEKNGVPQVVEWDDPRQYSDSSCGEISSLSGLSGITQL